MRSYRRRMNESMSDEEILKECERHTVILWYDFYLETTEGTYPDYEFGFIVSMKDVIKVLVGKGYVNEYLFEQEGIPYEESSKYSFTILLNYAYDYFDEMYEIYSDDELLVEFEDDAKEQCLNTIEDNPYLHFTVLKIL